MVSRQFREDGRCPLARQPSSGGSNSSATAQASALDSFVSSGAARAGFIQFNVTLGQLHGGDSMAVLSDGTHTYSYDALGAESTPPFGTCFEGCQWAATVPFDHGSEFQVNISSKDQESLAANPLNEVAHGNTDAIVTFRLLEADRTTPAPFSLTPEPSTLALFFAAVGAFGALAYRRRGSKSLLS